MPYSSVSGPDFARRGKSTRASCLFYWDVGGKTNRAGRQGPVQTPPMPPFLSPVQAREKPRTTYWSASPPFHFRFSFSSGHPPSAESSCLCSYIPVEGEGQGGFRATSLLPSTFCTAYPSSDDTSTPPPSPILVSLQDWSWRARRRARRS